MSKILIIGNVLKDVYLKLDDGPQNDFETDENGIKWLDLAFNGAAHTFYHRTSVYGGAAVSLATLSRLGVDAGILNSKTEFKNGELVWLDEPSDYRYIFCREGEITYFVPGKRKMTDWSMPNGTPEWILVDRSTSISAKLVDEIKNFLKFSPETKLAVHAEKKMTPVGQRLADMADVLFLEDEPAVHTEEKIVDKVELDQPNTQLVCHISPRKISLGEAEESWNLSRTDMLTHLTVYSTIVATVLGVLSVGGSPENAVLWARLNAEQSTLEGTLTARRLKELAKAELEKRANLKLIAQSIMERGRGVLAADQSSKTLSERMLKAGVAATAEKRRAFTEILLTTPELKDYASGVIISDEVAKQKTSQGRSFLEHLVYRGLIPGIKVDLGLVKLSETGETQTLGLNGLAERLRNYYDRGFRFAKWRAKFEITKDWPTFIAINKNAEQLASFAKECQLAGLVPVVESDIVMDGDFTIERGVEVCDRVLNSIFARLEERRVDLGGCILKTNMVTSGKDAVVPANANEIGIATAAVLRHATPKYLAGVLLLSGGQDPKTATKNLVAVCQNGPFPWPVTFAFGRALQDPVLLTWKGKPENVKAAQAALKRHLQDNADALRYLRK